MGRFNASVALAVAAVAIGTPACQAMPAAERSGGVPADPIGATVRDIHGRRVGIVREVEYARSGVRNVVIGLGVLRSGGNRYVIIPWEHLDTEGGELRFRGARERLVDASRRGDGATPR